MNKLKGFKSSNRVYTNSVLKHFKKFIKEYQLIGDDARSKDILVGVSGGVDSIVLLDILVRCGYSARAIYIHHGTRSGQDTELEFVKKVAEHLGVDFLSMKISGLDTNKNFEFKARTERYKLFRQVKKDNELIALAHHIDDSFEWSIMQGLKSSSLKGTVGIPVINGEIIRPLMCLTKNQIQNYAKFFDLPFVEDPTNFDVKHERNFLRHEVIASFSGRHPKYLKHYVNRHNELARQMGLHAKKKQKSSFKLIKTDNAAVLYNISSRLEFSGFEILVVQAMQYLNPYDRGSLHGQIDKIKQALRNNKFGPLILTKGIKAYISFNYVLICNDNFKSNYPDDFDDKSKLVKMNLKEFKHELKSLVDDAPSYPLWVILDNKSRGFSFNKRTFPLDEKYTEDLNNNDVSYLSALSLLAQWSKEKNRHKKLCLRFLVNF